MAYSLLTRHITRFLRPLFRKLLLFLMNYSGMGDAFNQGDRLIPPGGSPCMHTSAGKFFQPPVRIKSRAAFAATNVFSAGRKIVPCAATV